MKKLFVLSIAVLLFGSCSVPRAVGPYRVVHGKNKKVDILTNEEIGAKPAATPPAKIVEPLYKPNTVEDASVREEAFQAVHKEDKDKIKVYCVVIGSFSIENNAINLKKRLQPEYEPIIVMNEKGMFRVILASYNNISDARAKIAEVSNQFQDAWVLMQKK